MKKCCVLAAVLALCTLLFTGCRDDSGKATEQPATSATTQTTLIPSPDITLPMDTTEAARGHR